MTYTRAFIFNSESELEEWLIKNEHKFDVRTFNPFDERNYKGDATGRIVFEIAVPIEEK